jgi:hypothetical protein
MFSMAWYNTIGVSLRTLLSLWLPLLSYCARHKLLSGHHNANMLGKKSNNTTWMYQF